MKLFQLVLLILSFSFTVGAQPNSTTYKNNTTSPANAKETPKELFDRFFVLGISDTAEYAEKVKLMYRIFKTDSGSKYFYYVVTWSALISRKTKSYEQVKASIERLIAKNPDFAEAYFLDGLYLNKTKQEGVVEQMQKCIELNPQLSPPYFFLATYYYDAKNYKLAVTYYDLLEKADPKHKSVYYNRAITKVELNDFQGAITDYSLALSLQPNDSRIAFNRGMVYLELKNYKEAETDFNACILIDSNSGPAYYCRSTARYYLKKYDEACNDMKISAKLSYTKAIEYLKTACK